MKTAEIQARLEACSMEALPAELAAWEGDSRSTVQKLLERYRKKQAAYEKELARTEVMKKCMENIPLSVA